jgi:hypothetical protein
MFSEQCLQCTGIHIPPTFRDGTIPIDAIFATAGIECVNAYILPHKGGMGDHRCFIVDFTSSSIIGTKFPNIVRCSAQSFTANLLVWYSRIMLSWTCYAIAIRCSKGYTSFTHTLTAFPTTIFYI